MKKEVKIALVTIATLAVFYWGTNFLKGKDLFSSEKELYAVYDEVDGLVASSPVEFNGMQIGQVKKLNFVSPDDHRIIVFFTIKRDVEFPRNSTACITTKGVLGNKAVLIIPGTEMENLKSGDTLLARVDKGLMGDLADPARTGKLLSSVDSLLQMMTKMLNQNSQERMAESARNIYETIGHLKNISANTDQLIASQKQSIGGILKNVASITHNLEKNNDKITAIIGNFENISDSIAKANVGKTIGDLNTTLSKTASLLEKIDNGEGTLGQLANDKKLYDELAKSSENLNLLLKDLKENPKRYVSVSVFGGKSK